VKLNIVPSHRLHPINHDKGGTLWCGPAALATVTGLPTSKVHAALQRVTGRRVIKGVTNTALNKAANLLGYKLVKIWDVWVDDPGGFKVKRSFQPTLARFSKEFRAYYQGDVPVIVNVTGHYVTIHKRTFIDNQVKVATPLWRAPHRRCRVKRAWQVVKI
jgi:hypothetical protein